MRSTDTEETDAHALGHMMMLRAIGPSTAHSAGAWLLAAAPAAWGCGMRLRSSCVSASLALTRCVAARRCSGVFRERAEGPSPRGAG